MHLIGRFDFDSLFIRSDRFISLTGQQIKNFLRSRVTGLGKSHYHQLKIHPLFSHSLLPSETLFVFLKVQAMFMSVFYRYTLAQEHGDLINLHDWYQSFKATFQNSARKIHKLRQSPLTKKRKDITDESQSKSEVSLQYPFSFHSSSN